ncbi:hypothetical protein JDW15_09690 [Aerococcaceae bacterium zg-ZJ1578]|uniref:hypothetical protein n=1 Tax=Aerococcaceae bacterium zg-252 TaxID=2796928 RepID=UPI001A27A793|nr:hypothetical protein [Aerococcaceae bacterium zg-1578]
MKKLVLSLVLLLVMTLMIVPEVQAEDFVEDFFGVYSFNGDSKIRGIQIDKDYIEIILDMAQPGEGKIDNYSRVLQEIAKRFLTDENVVGMIDTSSNFSKDNMKEKDFVWRMAFTRSPLGEYPNISYISASPRYDLVDGKLFVSVHAMQLFRLQKSDDGNLVDKYGNEFEELSE